MKFHKKMAVAGLVIAASIGTMSAHADFSNNLEECFAECFNECVRLFPELNEIDRLIQCEGPCIQFNCLN